MIDTQRQPPPPGGSRKLRRAQTAAGGTTTACAGGQFPVGLQARQFEYMVKWGMTPAQALQTAMTVAADVLNYGWADRVGSLESGKYADIIAVAGDPLVDVKEMERVKFVMKGGLVVRNDLQAPSPTTSAQR